MDLSSVLSEVKYMPDERLRQELSQPTGMVPQWIVMGEMAERKKVRSEGQNVPAKPPIIQQYQQGYANGGLVDAFRYVDREWLDPIRSSLGMDRYYPDQEPSASMSMPTNMMRQPDPPSQFGDVTGAYRMQQMGMPAAQKQDRPVSAVKQQMMADERRAQAAFEAQRQQGMYDAGIQDRAGLRAMLEQQAQVAPPQVTPPSRSFAGVTSDDLAAAQNNIPVPAQQPDFYVIQRGDTLSAISKRLGIPMSDLMAANNIKDPNRIYAGAKLIIPRGYDEGGLVRALNPFINLTEVMQKPELAAQSIQDKLTQKFGGLPPLMPAMPAQASGEAMSLERLKPQAPGTPASPDQVGLPALMKRG